MSFIKFILAILLGVSLRLSINLVSCVVKSLRERKNINYFMKYYFEKEKRDI